MKAETHEPARLFRNAMFSTLCGGTTVPEFRRLDRFGSPVNYVLLGAGPLWPAYFVGPLHGIGVVTPPNADVTVTVTPPYSQPFVFTIPANAGPSWRRQFRPALDGAITVQFSAPGGVIEITHGTEALV